MDTLQHIELLARYRELTREQLISLVTDLVDIAREQAHAHGNDEGLKYLASFADSVAGPDALEAARDAFVPRSKQTGELYVCWIAGIPAHKTQRVIFAPSSFDARWRFVQYSGQKDTLTVPDVCARPLASHVDTIEGIATKARELISRAENDGIRIHDGNVVDLLADHFPRTPLPDLRTALVVAGYGDRFPKAINRRDA